jgi:hypothetical protein
MSVFDLVDRAQILTIAAGVVLGGIVLGFLWLVLQIVAHLWMEWSAERRAIADEQARRSAERL